MKMVFDSSSLISVSQTCLLGTLHAIQKKTGAEFIIPESVFKEAVGRPLGIKRFELNAVRLKKAVDDGWINVRKVKGRNRGKIMSAANNCFYRKGKAIALLQRGEVDALALALEEKAGTLVVDERTARMLVEAPLMLRRVMEKRYRERVSVERGNVKRMQALFNKLDMVRSVELIALAFDLGLLQETLDSGKKGLEGALYAAKFNGCAVSMREISRFLGGVRLAGKRG